MLGGYGFTHDLDIKDSAKLIERLRDQFHVQLGSVLGKKCLLITECGAGIGRIAHSLLTKYYKRTDLLEPAANLMAKAKESLKDNPNIGEFHQKGMEEFEFAQKYDTIWIQWVIGYLTDNDLLAFLHKCKDNLNTNGVVVIKDNACEHYGFILDKSDCSIARNVNYYNTIFNHAGYDVLLTERFKEFPEDAMPIMKFVIRPRV